MFTNLLDNAIKYLAPDRPGKITVTGERRDDRAVYHVEDNGIGIAENNLARVFQLFYRLEPKGPIPGEGMGLAIVKRIIDRHGGSVEVTSTEGVGTRATVTLPADPIAESLEET